jgi:hypothetical protein
VRKLSDYKEALVFMRQMEEIIHLHHQEPGIDLTRTTVLEFVLNSWASYSNRKRKLFIDERLNQLFHEIFEPFSEMSNYRVKNMHPTSNRNIYLKSMDMEFPYENLGPVNANISVDWDYITNKIKSLIDKYHTFKDAVLLKKNENEIHFNS